MKAGFRAFARDGYEGARIADIAAEARISIGSFYHRFGDKRGFFNVLAEEFVSRSERNWDRFFALVDRACSADELFRPYHHRHRIGRCAATSASFTPSSLASAARPHDLTESTEDRRIRCREAASMLERKGDA